MKTRSLEIFSNVFFVLILQNKCLSKDGETALHKACKMCNYDVLKCLIDFAKANKAESFKTYINAVNVKVPK